CITREDASKWMSLHLILIGLGSKLVCQSVLEIMAVRRTLLRQKTIRGRLGRSSRMKLSRSHSINLVPIFIRARSIHFPTVSCWWWRTQKLRPPKSNQLVDSHSVERQHMSKAAALVTYQI